MHTWAEKVSLSFLILKVFCVVRALYCIVFGFNTDALFWIVIALGSGAIAFGAHWIIPKFVKNDG
jgi:hypothetical protein